MQRCRDAGLQLLDETPRTGAGGKQIAFLHPRSRRRRPHRDLLGLASPAFGVKTPTSRQDDVPRRAVTSGACGQFR